MLDDVVVVLVVESVVVQLALLLLPVRVAVLVLPDLSLLRASLLFGIVDFVDVLVRLDQINRELPVEGKKESNENCCSHLHYTELPYRNGAVAGSLNWGLLTCCAAAAAAAA